MDTIARVPDKSEGAAQCQKLLMGQQSQIFKVSGLLYVKFNLGDPPYGMIISQTSLTLFEVGFKKISRIAELGMPHFIFFNQPVDNGTGFLADEFLPQLIHEVRVNMGPTANEACIQNGGEHLEIVGCELQALLQGPGGITDIKTNVPQWLDDFLDQFRRLGGNLFLK